MNDESNIKQNKGYENRFLKRLNEYGTIEKAISSYSTGISKNSTREKENRKEKRKKLKDYRTAFPEFDKIVIDTVELLKEQNKQPKTKVYNDSYKKEYDLIAYKLRSAGVTIEVVAKFIGVNSKTIHEWKKKYKSFKDAFDKVLIDDLMDTAEAVQKTSKIYELTTVRTEKGFTTGESGEPIPIDKTITTVTQHPPIMAAVKLKLAQANNRLKKPNKNLLGYVPPVDAVVDKPISLNITMQGSEDEFSLNNSEDDSPNNESKEEEENI